MTTNIKPELIPAFIEVLKTTPQTRGTFRFQDCYCAAGCLLKASGFKLEDYPNQASAKEIYEELEKLTVDNKIPQLNGYSLIALNDQYEWSFPRFILALEDEPKNQTQ